MNKSHLLLVTFLFTVVGVFVTARSGGPAAVLGTGYTGAPSEGNCSSCHLGGSYGAVTPQIEVFQLGTSTPVTSYSPGTQYDMKVTVNNSTGTPVRYGFQLTALKNIGNIPLAGYSNLGAGVHQATAGGRTYLEQSSTTLSNQYTFRWTAPTAGTGAVKFYASGNCVNNNGGTSGDNAGTGTFTLNEAVALAVSGTKVDVSCFGQNNGSINITATGGTPGYTYLWSDGNTAEDRTNLAPGNYSVTVTDAATNSVTSITFVVAQPSAPLTISLSVGPIACSGGLSTVTLNAAGGTSPYTGTGILNLSPGTHTQTVIDQKGCTKDTTFTIAPAPSPITVNVVANGLIPCNGNGTTVTVSATGGSGNYTGTGTFQVITPGTVSYTVTDVNNCTGAGSVLVEAVSGLTVTTDLLQPGCGDTCAGAFSSQVQTNSLPYTETLTYVNMGTTVNNDSTLCPGDYQYQVTDDAGCTFDFDFTIESPSFPQVSLTQITPANGGNNGAVDILVSGGVSPYSFEWSNGSINEDLSNVAAGTYSVSVTGANECEEVLSGIEVYDIAGIDDVSFTNLRLYPNPFQGTFQLSDISWHVKHIQDMYGKPVFFKQSGNTIVLNNAIPGVYVVLLSKNGKEISVRLVCN